MKFLDNVKPTTTTGQTMNGIMKWEKN